MKTAKAHNAQLTGSYEFTPNQGVLKRKRKYISPYRQGIKDCDMLWAFIIKARAGWRCELAGKDNVRCTDLIQTTHPFPH